MQVSIIQWEFVKLMYNNVNSPLLFYFKSSYRKFISLDSLSALYVLFRKSCEFLNEKKYLFIEKEKNNIINVISYLMCIFLQKKSIFIS